MSKTITSHTLENPWNELRVEATGFPDVSGAHNVYEIGGFTSQHPTAYHVHPGFNLVIPFQKGNPVDGRNGVTIEALVAICIDRLRDHQTGPFHCWENQNALTSLIAAQETLKSRTRMRQARGVAGKLVP